MSALGHELFHSRLQRKRIAVPQLVDRARCSRVVVRRSATSIKHFKSATDAEQANPVRHLLRCRRTQRAVHCVTNRLRQSVKRGHVSRVEHEVLRFVYHNSIAPSVIVDRQQFVIRQRRVKGAVGIGHLVIARVHQASIALILGIGPNLIDLAAQFKIVAKAVVGHAIYHV